MSEDQGQTPFGLPVSFEPQEMPEGLLATSPDAIPAEPETAYPHKDASSGPSDSADGSVMFDAWDPVPQPWNYGADTSKNWQGKAALTTSILGIGVAGIVLGWMGLRSARSGQANNKSMSMAGIALGVLGTLLLLLFPLMLSIPSLLGSAGDAGYDPQVGDCYDTSGVATGSAGEAVLDGFNAVDCSLPHVGQVYLTGTLAEGTYDFDALSASISPQCVTDAALSAIDRSLPYDLYIQTFVPDAESWEQGERGFQCTVAGESDTLTQSVVLEY